VVFYAVQLNRFFSLSLPPSPCSSLLPHFCRLAFLLLQASEDYAATEKLNAATLQAASVPLSAIFIGIGEELIRTSDAASLLLKL
jgi:hypothetical protein